MCMWSRWPMTNMFCSSTESRGLFYLITDPSFHLTSSRSFTRSWVFLICKIVHIIPIPTARLDHTAGLSPPCFDATSPTISLIVTSTSIYWIRRTTHQFITVRERVPSSWSSPENRLHFRLNYITSYLPFIPIWQRLRLSDHFSKEKLNKDLPLVNFYK